MEGFLKEKNVTPMCVLRVEWNKKNPSGLGLHLPQEEQKEQKTIFHSDLSFSHFLQSVKSLRLNKLLNLVYNR